MGLSNLVTHETRTQGTTTLTEKFYSYDALGRRVALTDDPDGEGAGGAAKSFTYGYDPHGSVSLLLHDQGASVGAVEATYGYDPYGNSDQGASSGSRLSEGDLDDELPLNPYRYTGKRLDTGSGTIDMGARRFGPDITRFLQRDFFGGALSDLGLSADPLTGNRYALASGNPVSFVEWDGHVPVDGGGVDGPCKTCPAQKPDPGPTTSTSDYLTGTEYSSQVWDYPPVFDWRANECVTECAEIVSLVNRGVQECLSGLTGKLKGILGGCDRGGIENEIVSQLEGELDQRAPIALAMLGTGPSPRFDIHPRVHRQLQHPRLGPLRGKLTADDLQGLVNNPFARRLLDTAPTELGKSATINVVQRIGGRLLRITTASDAFRIISVGPIRATQITNGIARGRFIPLS